MAEKRMFAKTIIDSDAFLEMPMSARLLYYDLAMRADDDGFVNSPKKIMRITGASPQDLEILKADKFILPFDDKGLVVIKHWFIHNYIRKDTYKETPYLEEKSMLTIDEKGAYTFDVTEPSQVRDELVDEPSTQIRIDKNRLDKNRLDKRESIDHEAIASKFCELCPSLSPIQVMSDKRKRLLNNLLKNHSLDDLYKAFEKAESSDFLKGSNSRGWKATFDWLIEENNFIRVIEGNYDNQEGAGNKTNYGSRAKPYIERTEPYTDEMIKDWLLRAADDG